MHTNSEPAVATSSSGQTKPGILVFRRCFYFPTETFIYTQVNYLKDFFTIYLVADRFMPGNKYDFSRLHKVVLNGYEKKLGRFTNKILGRKIEPQFQFHNHRQVKRLIRQKEIKLIHAHFGPEAIKILPVAKKNGLPLVVSFHGYDASKLLINDWYRSRLPELFSYADKIVVSASHMVETLGLGQWKDKVLLLPYGIDVEKFKPSEREENDKISLLHSGRLVNKKGVPDLIRVFANVYATTKNLQLTIVGDGPELEICQAEARALGVADAVRFLGVQPHARVRQIMNEADIFVLNSRVADDGDMEGTPVSILEAMSMEKAVVSTYHAGIPYVIQDNQNGRLVPEKDNERLEQAIREIVADENKRKELGREARRTVVARFSQENSLPVLRDAIARLVAKPGEQPALPNQTAGVQTMHRQDFD